MNRIEKLIEELCPEGVEYKELGEIGLLYGGITGKSKENFTNGNAKFISYMNVFSNIEIDIDTEEKVFIGESERQNTIELGDVLFTGSSEILEESGMSSVLTTQTDENLYLNSFCFGFRLHDKSIFLPGFLKYLFRDINIRKQIIKTANGVTRFNVSKKRFQEVIIPIPPLPIQEAIVDILDKFTKLEAELEAELEARKSQYEYYRNELLTPIEKDGKWWLNGVEVEWKKLGEIGECKAGATPRTTIKEYWNNGTIPWMNSGEVNKRQIYETENRITELGFNNSSTKMVPANTVVVALAGQGKTRGTVAITRIPLCTNQSLCSIVIENSSINNNYVYYYMITQYNKLRRISSGDGTRGGLNIPMIQNYIIPLPPLSEQERIVSILDKFDALVNDITVGLPAEIEARRKQYEYYRNKLLTFEK